METQGWWAIVRGSSDVNEETQSVGTSGGSRPDTSAAEAVGPLKMPATPERAARDIAAVGVEGRPADAAAGPGMLRLEMLGLLVGLAAISAAVGIWVNWGLGVVLLVVGVLGLLFNPVMGATAMRSKDRKVAADMEKGREPRSIQGGG
jgi:hypothetical protein